MSFKFKNTGQDLDEIKRRFSKNIKVENQDLLPIGIKTPLSKGVLHGETLFSMNFDIMDQIADNLKNLIMTQKGERIGRGDFGTNLYQIYSNTNVEKPEELAIEEISRTVGKFMPQVSLKDYESKKVENRPGDPVDYEINIFYTVPAISTEVNSIFLKIRMTN